MLCEAGAVLSAVVMQCLGQRPFRSGTGWTNVAEYPENEGAGNWDSTLPHVFVLADCVGLPGLHVLAYCTIPPVTLITIAGTLKQVLTLELKTIPKIQMNDWSKIFQMIEAFCQFERYLWRLFYCNLFSRRDSHLCFFPWKRTVRSISDWHLSIVRFFT